MSIEQPGGPNPNELSNNSDPIVHNEPILMKVEPMEDIMNVAHRAMILAEKENKNVQFNFNDKPITVIPGMTIDEIEDQRNPGHLKKVKAEKRLNFLRKFNVNEDYLKNSIEEMQSGNNQFPAQTILAASLELGIINDGYTSKILNEFRDAHNKKDTNKTESLVKEMFDLAKKIHDNYVETNK